MSKEYLRDLAKKQLEYALKDENIKKKELWYQHNAVKGSRPIIVIEDLSFKDDLFSLTCQDEDSRFIENQLLLNLRSYEYINDDKVIPDYFKVPVKMNYKLFNQEIQRKISSEGLGYHDEPIINDLEEDLQKLAPTKFSYDQKKTEELKKKVEDVIGDILPIKPVNTNNIWHFGITERIVNLMGMEKFFTAFYDSPEGVHQLMRKIVDDNKRFLRWQEKHTLIFPNNGNDYMGSGSYCFNDELVPKKEVRSIDTWGHINSQETVGISSDTFGEFIFPYYAEMAKEFGLIYYGCCEPVHDLWEKYISQIKNIRKISISPWCNEEVMAENLSGTKIIYSRKPSPNYLGVTKELDEDGLRNHLKKTINLTKECKVEFIFRDIYSLNGNREKLKRTVEIFRSLI